MSNNYLSKEDAINQLYATIKTKFEQDGVLQEVRCMLQAKMVAMMKGKNESQTTLLGRPIPDLSKLSAGSKANSNSAACTMDGVEGGQDPRLKTLNELIMEYLHWHGFHYTAEMFTQESGTDNLQPSRQQLERQIGPFEHKSVPILLELIADLMEKNES
ncbi:centrosomal protein 20 [Eurosta solidaginis]|uniref:centrosomal protein 20 n=1 Tax=Eurosta solidaginis TaxID=178769 RepID=UPI003530E37E